MHMWTHPTQINRVSPVRAQRKALSAELTDLRDEWRGWKRARFEINLPFIDYCLVCPATHGGQCVGPTCEGCAATAARRDVRKQIEARAAVVKADLAALDTRRRRRSA